jgi:hypothetical protein
VHILKQGVDTFFTTVVLVNASAVDASAVDASVVDDIFLVSPASLNVTVDTVAVFQCQHPTAHGVNWKINGSILQILPEGFSTDRSDDGVFSLNIEALAKYNQTVIQCVAFFANSPSEESEQSIMMIQGIYLILICALTSTCIYRLDTEAKGSTGFRILKTLI